MYKFNFSWLNRLKSHRIPTMYEQYETIPFCVFSRLQSENENLCLIGRLLCKAENFCYVVYIIL